jgi:hypothetical protein
MNQDPRLRRGAHRTRRAASATLLPSLLAILAVTSLITALYVWRGEEAQPPSAAASGHSPTPRGSTASPQASTASPQASTAAPSVTSPAATASDPATATTESATTATSAPAGHKKTGQGAQLRASIAIVVLNQTVRAGLAATVATQLRAKGWTVSGVGNFRGVVPATTVYYPAGHEAAAAAAARSLPTPPRVLPRFGNLSLSRLTVVVTTNYPG